MAAPVIEAPARTTPSQLRLTRLARGITAETVVAALGITSGTLSRVERGRLPTWPRFRQQMAAMLQVDEAALFADDGTLL